MIYKTFFGKHIDLSKLVSISDAYYGDHVVKFQMHFQLLDKPIEYWRSLNYQTEHDDGVIMENGSKTNFPYGLPIKPVAVINLQKQVDEIIAAWRDYKRSQLKHDFEYVKYIESKLP